MATRQQDYGYEQTLIYGRYNRQLSDYAKYQAQKHKSRLSSTKVTKATNVYRLPKWCKIPKRCQSICGVFEKCMGFMIKKIGEDWVFLAALGVIMALLSFCMDVVIEKCQEAKISLFKVVAFSVPLQYFVWVSYSVVFILFATAFTHFVSPQAIGSGIPEMKTILRGVVLKEYLTFKTLIAKVVGLCSSLGSTLPIGKEGPFVHIASIVANLLGKLSSFKGIYENESRKTEMLAAACAVGVACTFAAPIGGVLFSIEVTSTYFAVRNYWRGFFAAVCGAVVWRLLAHWFKNEETITALFKTHLQTEFPFDALELFVFAAIGVVCGFAGAMFVYLHRKLIIFARRRKNMMSCLQKNRFIYPGLVALLVSSLTFPPGLGQFTAGQLTHKEAIDELFSNQTWTTANYDTKRVSAHWHHDNTSNVFINLALFVMTNFCLSCVSNTLPVPAGIFFPVFTVGAGFGRLIGESMATWFPEGIKGGGSVVRRIIPAGYAVVGAAALSGSVTRTISTSLIVFELTGQISHVLPAVIAVLIANAVAHPLQPSFFDSIIKLKRLPYLPDIVSAKSRVWNYFAEDIMVKDVKYVPLSSTYGDLKTLLMTTYHTTYPLVDSNESMILLGSINRFELERRLIDHMDSMPPHYDRGDDRIAETNIDLVIDDVPRSVAPDSKHGGIMVSRFQVSKVVETEGQLYSDEEQMTLPMSISTLKVPQMSRSASEPNLAHPLKSILKKPSPISSPTAQLSTHSLNKSESRCHFTDDTVDNERRQSEREAEKLQELIDFKPCRVDPAPFQLVERTSLHKVHSLFSLLGLNHSYVTNTGRLVGIVALKEIRDAVQGTVDAQSRDTPDGGGVDHFLSQDQSSDEDLDDPAMLQIVSPLSTGYDAHIANHYIDASIQ